MNRYTELSKPPGHRSDLVKAEAREYYTALLRPLFEGRRFIHAGGLAVGLGREARTLAALGAAKPLILAYGEGTGQIPGPEEAILHVYNVQGRDIVDQHRQALAALEHLPRDVTAMIDRWDPDRLARFLCWPSDISSVAGRKSYAPRKPAWIALEDKTAIDAFWDAAGVRRAPSRVVAAERRALIAAAAALDEGLGTVWAADVKSGIHGGAVGLRWVRPGGDPNAAADSLREIADRVRVMPFLEGIPVSIHGIVFEDAVTVFRPVEMIVLRPRKGDRLLFAGCSNWFDPRTEDREAMRRHRAARGHRAARAGRLSRRVHHRWRALARRIRADGTESPNRRRVADAIDRVGGLSACSVVLRRSRRRMFGVSPSSPRACRVG